jgi:hypothetical protein
MAAADYDIGIKVHLEDAKNARETLVKVTFKDPRTGKDHVHEERVRAPANASRVNQSVAEALKNFGDRGLGLVDCEKFKSDYKSEDNLPPATEMHDPGKPPSIGGPDEKKETDDGKKSPPPAQEKKPEPPAKK